MRVVVSLVRVLLLQVAKDLSWRLTDRVDTCRELCFGDFLSPTKVG